MFSKYLYSWNDPSAVPKPNSPQNGVSYRKEARVVQIPSLACTVDGFGYVSLFNLWL